MRESKEARETRVKEEIRKRQAELIQTMKETVKKNWCKCPADYNLAFEQAREYYEKIAFHVYMHGCDRVDYPSLLAVYTYGFVMGSRATLAGKFKEEE